MTDDTTRVLIVEDDPDFAESLVIALGVRHCQVDVARSGEEAIRKFHDICYDIAFMDIKLPGKSGVECLIEIIGFRPQARVVMMTGYSESEILEKARQAGAVDILRKPFRLKELFAYIDRLRQGTSPPVRH